MTQIPLEILEESVDTMTFQKQKACEFAIQHVEERMRVVFNNPKSIFGTTTSMNPSYSKKHEQQKYTKQQIDSFFQSLKENVVFDMGFKVYGFHIHDEKKCWCPLGKQMRVWRQEFGLSQVVQCDKFCDAPRNMTPQGKSGSTNNEFQKVGTLVNNLLLSII